MLNQPLVSIIIPTKNASGQLKKCLEGIKRQTYDNYEIIVSDGLSKDNTLEIARKYKARTVVNKKILAEPGVSLGFQNAKGEILIVLAVDNIFKEKEAIEVIVKVFNNKNIFAAFPKHDSAQNDTLWTKYINVFTDPFNHFVYGYAANARTFNKIFKTVVSNDVYDIYDFKSAKTKPILALAQGFSVRKEFINRKRNEMDDIAPVLELIKQGEQIAYLHSVGLYHHTINSMGQFVRKMRWTARNALLGKKFGINSRFSTLSKKQKVKMYLFPIYSLSFIFPCINALIHLIIDREKMWIFHPFIASLSGVSIVFEYVKIKLGLIGEVSK